MRSLDRRCLTVVVALLACVCGGCGGGGGGGGGSSAGPSVPNSVPIIVDGGPAAAATTMRIINVPYVSVNVCFPATSNCITIDHVLVDTGSSGLRLVQSALGSLTLPAVTDAGSNALGECVTFADGYVWGSVRQADIHLSQEVALAASIQVIGDSSAVFAATPSDCSATGIGENTVASLGANGILGVGLFTDDCDACINKVIAATYYSCPASGCVNASVTSTQVVKNPVALFATDKNGVVIDLPAVGPTGAANLPGALIFGIGTQSNNALGSAKVYKTDINGNFSTSYKSSTPITSFIDSGSNALFFADTTITACATSIGFYCPTPPLTVSATNTGAGGSATGPVSVTIVDVDTLPGSVTAANAGGTMTSLTGFFDWGLPFFFGRPVFTAIAAPGASGSYWAY